MADKNLLLARQKKISLTEHYNRFGGPEFLTNCFKNSVPILGFVNWKILDVKEGYCKSVIPFDSISKNQNTTHQAALYLLSADYTGGASISNHIRLPSLGIHPNEICDDYGIEHWLLYSEIKFLKKSTNNLFATSTITDEEINTITNIFYKKGKVLKTVNIDLTNDENELLGKVKMKYMMQLLSVEEWKQKNNGGQ